VSIRAVAGDVPTGADLTSGTINGDMLTTDEAGLWYQIKMSSTVVLPLDAAYAIVIRAPSGTIANMCRWRDWSGGGLDKYTGGHMCYSANSGTDWTAYNLDDFDFELYGYNLEPRRFEVLMDTLRRGFK
jgi:hypothetical protein